MGVAARRAQRDRHDRVAEARHLPGVEHVAGRDVEQRLGHDLELSRDPVPVVRANRRHDRDVDDVGPAADRVLLVGETRAHGAVRIGRIRQQVVEQDLLDRHRGFDGGVEGHHVAIEPVLRQAARVFHVHEVPVTVDVSHDLEHVRGGPVRMRRRNHPGAEAT